MNRGHGFIPAVALSLGNGMMMGAALTTSHPLQYLALAAGVGTFVNLTYVLAAKLWRVSTFDVRVSSLPDRD